LRSNEQLLSGTKPDLVERCVDRSLYGNLPRCPQCSLGRLKVSYARALGHGGMGIFTCPGGYDDDQYVRCSYRTTSVERPKWTVTDVQATAAAAPTKSGGKSAAAPKAAASKAAKSMAAASAAIAAAAPAPAPAPAPAAKSCGPSEVRVAMPGDDD
jgi:hypothetical protein